LRQRTIDKIRLFTIVAIRNFWPGGIMDSPSERMPSLEREPDGTRPHLSADRLQELGNVARGYLAEQITDDELERVVRSVSRHARDRGMKAEELIVACKEMWRGLPATAFASERSATAKKLERIVTICIEGYFADR